MKTYSHPHYRQSHTWQRFARILSDVRDYAYQRKEDALAWSLEKGTHGFAIPTTLELEAKDSRGLELLIARREAGDPFPEIDLRERYDESKDRLDVEVTLHRQTRTRREAVCVGTVKEEDAQWLRPLLKSHLKPSAFIANVEQRSEKGSLHTGLEVTVAISRPDEAAREWIDLYDNRKQKAKASDGTRRTGVPAYIPSGGSGGYPGTDYNRKIADTRDELSRLQLKANKLEAKRVSCAHVGRKIQRLKGKVKHLQKKAAQSECRVAEQPTAEEWLRENISARETCMTDLPSRDYWSAAHRM